MNTKTLPLIFLIITSCFSPIGNSETEVNTTLEVNSTNSSTTNKIPTTSNNTDFINLDLGNNSSSSSISDSSENTSISESVCGNKIVEPGEECDEGLIPTRTCGADCKPIICGDGIVSISELCDDGNNEELDNCSNDCFTPRWAFLTNDYIGAANFGGLSKADTFCQKNADLFGLDGTYLAWLSDDDPFSSPVFRMETDFKGWYRLRSPFPSPLAKGWQGLTSLDLENPLNITPNGLFDQTVVSVWTATNDDGTKAEGSTCDNWTFLGMGEDYQVTAGDPQKKEHNGWSTGYIKGCNSEIGAKLYCFEVQE